MKHTQIASLTFRIMQSYIATQHLHLRAICKGFLCEFCEWRSFVEQNKQSAEVFSLEYLLLYGSYINNSLSTITILQVEDGVWV